jgi:hypothetical protein
MVQRDSQYVAINFYRDLPKRIRKPSSGKLFACYPCTGTRSSTFPGSIYTTMPMKLPLNRH